MALPSLASFNLVGGTSLALRYGHRVSVDLDLFTPEAINKKAILEDLAQIKWSGYQELFALDTGIQIILNGIKTDFVKYSYNYLKPPEIIEGIRILSVPDVAAMKLAAISQRGAKKDFYDLHLLLQHFSIKQLLGFFTAKYPGLSTFHVVKSMNYYSDAEGQANPETKMKITWSKVKTDIDSKVTAYLSK